MKKDDKQAIYLYCLTRFDSLPAIEGTGVDGKDPLFTHSMLDIVAVLSMVSLEAFCGPSAESRMKDLSWVGPRACCHEEVIEQVMRHSSVLPTRFGTIFSSLDSLEKFLKMHHGTISQFLDQVACKEEWSVKGLMDKAKAKEDLLSEILAREAGRLASLSPGARYFEEQRIRASIEKELKVWLEENCRRIANDLSHSASDFCQRRVVPGDSTGMGVYMVLNWAFLVPRSITDDFLERIHRTNVNHAPQGLVFEVSGPWPPYSFCPSLKIEEKG